MLKRNHFLSRREILGTSVGAVFLAPLLRQRRVEAQLANPKRLVMVFTPDSHPPEWWPTRNGATGFTLNEPLADFVGLESNMLFVQRLDHAWTSGNHHEAGPPQLFTGAQWVSETQHIANGPSIDHIMLAADSPSNLRGGTPLAGIHVSAGGGGRGGSRDAISYSGPGQPVSKEEQPARAFTNIFSGVTFGASPGAAPVTPPAVTPPTSTTPSAADAVAQARARVKKRILQVDTAQLKRLQTYLGRYEREKLELHVQSLYELEKQLPVSGGPAGTGGVGGGGTITGTPAPVGGICERVDTTGVTSNTRDADITTRQARAQADIIVNAFTCDRTHVADFGMSFSGGHHEGLLGFAPSWHDNVAHISRTNDAVTVGTESMTTRQAFIKFDRFWAGHVAYLAKRLAGIKEGDGTMLDNTLIAWGVESGTNHNHRPSDIQYLLIGGKNLGFKTGQFLNVGTQSSNKLLTSILNAFGHPATGIGIEPMIGTLTGVL